MGILKAESYKKGVVLSTIFSVFSKGLTFFNSLVIAYFFGSQIKTDIYSFTYNSIILFGGFLSNLNAAVLIPESMRIRVQDSETSAMRFLNFFLYAYLLLTIIVAGIFFIDPAVTFAAISNFEKHDLDNHILILYMAMPLFILVAITNFLTDILSSYKYFTLPMIVGMINGLLSISFVVILHRWLDIGSVVAGLLTSYLLNIFILVYLLRKQLSWKFSFHLFPISRKVWKNIGFAQAGNIGSMLCSYAPLYFFSGMGAGLVTTLNVAQQISSFPTALITNQFSFVAGIKFNELHANKEFNQLNNVFLKTIGFLLFILIPVSSLFFLYAEQIVTFLFRRGAFSTEAVGQSAIFLKYLGLLLPMQAINLLVARMFMAAHKIKQTFWYQLLMNLLLIVMIYLGVQWFQIYGYLGAVLVNYFISTLILFFFFKVLLPVINYKHVIITFFKLQLLNAVVVCFMLFLNSILEEHFSVFVQLILGSLVYLICVLAINYFFNINKEIIKFFKTFKLTDL